MGLTQLPEPGGSGHCLLRPRGAKDALPRQTEMLSLPGGTEGLLRAPAPSMHMRVSSGDVCVSPARRLVLCSFLRLKTSQMVLPLTPECRRVSRGRDVIVNNCDSSLAVTEAKGVFCWNLSLLHSLDCWFLSKLILLHLLEQVTCPSPALF